MKCTRPVLERCKTGPVEIIERPCGKCPACRSQKAQEWTYRLYAEQKLHAKSCFITLTYDDENLSRRLRKSEVTAFYSLDKKELQDFMKRLRKNSGVKLRFYGVGEYGEHTHRPHFHLIVFGLDENDERVIRQSWQFGFVKVGSVTPSSIAYVARYCVKKLYEDRFDYADMVPEFSLMSNRPGIGFNAIEKGVRRTKDNEIFVWFQGKRLGVPRYFKDKIRSAYDSYVARFKSLIERDDTYNRAVAEGRVIEDEWYQAEKNARARIKARRKI